MTAHESVVYDIHDFKVRAMTADTGVAPTYAGTQFDVPGISACSMQPNLVTAELKGDAKVIAKKGRVDRFNFSVTYGRIALDVLPIFFGGTVTDPVGGSKWSFPGVNSLPFFKASFQISDAEVGDVHITAFKCQVTGGTLLDQSSDNFGQPKIDFEAIPCNSDDDLFLDIDFLDAVTALT